MSRERHVQSEIFEFYIYGQEIHVGQILHLLGSLSFLFCICIWEYQFGKGVGIDNVPGILHLGYRLCFTSHILGDR